MKASCRWCNFTPLHLLYHSCGDKQDWMSCDESKLRNDQRLNQMGNAGTVSGGVAQLVEQSKKRILFYNAHVAQLVGGNRFKSCTVRVRISPWVPSSYSIMVLHALGKGRTQVQFLLRAPIVFCMASKFFESFLANCVNKPIITPRSYASCCSFVLYFGGILFRRLIMRFT